MRQVGPGWWLRGRRVRRNVKLDASRLRGKCRTRHFRHEGGVTQLQLERLRQDSAARLHASGLKRPGGRFPVAPHQSATGHAASRLATHSQSTLARCNACGSLTNAIHPSAQRY
jgi:hypothetical protein